MTDAEVAQQNAVDEVFGVDSDFTYLMCFYHVHEKLKGVPQHLCKRVVADIYDLHFASSQEAYGDQVKVVLAKWDDEDLLTEFKSYFNNRVLALAVLLHTQRRDYTLRTKHKIGTLIQLLADCCGSQSTTPRLFKEAPEATQQLRSRVNDFRQRNILVDMTPSRSSIEFLLVSPSPNIVMWLWCICLTLGAARKTPPVSAQMGANYARMEVEGQSDGGWEVDVSAQTCVCKYHFKFAMCIHVLFALQVKSYTGTDGKRTLVNRSATRKRRRTQTTATSRVAAGRPHTNGHALSSE
ncbi:LOW QUALITY PROTEIN: hypothetical protein PHMEG_00018244 [Phytophthora megakarya]|uniref:SWIM-type domain-containing protein n=1 Tax=Phytophthora megakarya TaxID=4795 RepID=A0A225VUH4_9STRA|nr:LOW QUALITY PROTEIN: hypothetical protein PHMEG_00018244 [Phytophthora megakarya]